MSSLGRWTFSDPAHPRFAAVAGGPENLQCVFREDTLQALVLGMGDNRLLAGA